MIEFAVSIAPSSDDLFIGFLDPLTDGGGFDSLHFQVFVEGNLEVDQTFLTAAAADAFFDDQLVTISSSLAFSDTGSPRKSLTFGTRCVVSMISWLPSAIGMWGWLVTLT